jgi:hypothetical protein
MAKKASKKEVLVVASKVKAYIKSKGCRLGAAPGFESQGS